ncbi:MAG TPA: hypothetical protein PLD70_12310 [Thermotogota bacterium]|nr:hypothetical protein [Thermotogota bacterium]
MTVWSSKESVNRAITTLARIWGKTGTLPQDLVSTYQEIAERSSRSIRAAFWELLAEKAPDCLEYFIKGEEK